MSLDWVQRARLLRGVSSEALSAICPEFEIFGVDRAERVFVQGDSAAHVYLVVSGRIKLAYRTHDCRELIIAVLGDGDHFGELSVFDRGPRATTATALEPTTLARVPSGVLEDWLAQHPDTARAVLRTATLRARRADQRAADAVFVDLPGRVARQLLEFARVLGEPSEHGVMIRHGLKQTELAQLVGGSRETVNKVLADFSRKGWIRATSKVVVVTDLAGLAQYIGHSCSDVWADQPETIRSNMSASSIGRERKGE